MKLISIKPSTVSGKKLTAKFCACKTGNNSCPDKDKVTIHFGSATSTTYAEGASDEKRDAYIARHKVNENWDKINAGSLSRYVLWSHKSLKEGIAEFKRRFHC